MFKSTNSLPFNKKEDSFSFDSIDAPKWVDFSKLDSDPQEEDDSWFDDQQQQSIPKELLDSFGGDKVEIPRCSPKGKKEISFAKVIGETQRAVTIVGETQKVPPQLPTEEPEEPSAPISEDSEPLEQQQQQQPEEPEAEPEPEFDEEEEEEEEEEQQQEQEQAEEGGFAIKRKRKMNMGIDEEEEEEGFGGDYYYSSDSYYHESSDCESRPKKMRRTAPQPPGPLTNPQTPNLRTKVRGQMHEEKFNRMVAQEEELFKKNALFKAGEIKHYKSVSRGEEYKGERGEGLTAPVTPKLETRMRGEAKEQMLAEKIRREEEEFSSYTGFKAGEINYHTNTRSAAPSAPRPLTAPVTPHLQTRTRGEMKEQQLAEKIRREEESQQIEQFKAGEINYHTNTRSAAPSAPRPLTAPVTPRLQTRARGEMKEQQLAEKIRREEELHHIEPFKAGEINHHTSRSHPSSAPRPLTAPVTPNLRTRVRGEVKEQQLAHRIRKEEEENTPKQFKAGEIKRYRSVAHDAPAPRPLTAPVTPNLRTRVRGEGRKPTTTTTTTNNNTTTTKQYQPRGLTQPISPRLSTRTRVREKRSDPLRETSSSRKGGRSMVRKERDLTTPQPFSFQTEKRVRNNTPYGSTNENNDYSGEKKYNSSSVSSFSSPLSANRIREDNVTVKL